MQKTSACLLQHYNNADIPLVHVYNSHTYSLVRLFKPEKAELGMLSMWLPLRSLKQKVGGAAQSVPAEIIKYQ